MPSSLHLLLAAASAALLILSRPTAAEHEIPWWQPKPTPLPTLRPTTGPTRNPTSVPSARPTVSPTTAPSSSPSPPPTGTPTSRPSSSPSDSPSSSPTVPDKIYMTFEPIWLDVVFPKGMKSQDTSPTSSLGGGIQEDDTSAAMGETGSDSEDGGGAPTSSAAATPAADTNKDADDDDSSSVFVTVDTIKRKEYRAMTSTINHVVTDIVNDQLPLLNKFYWEAYLDTKLMEKTMIYPRGIPSSGGGEDGAWARLKAKLAGKARLVLKYEIMGQYSFINVTDTVLPTEEDLKVATAQALNANVLYRELKQGPHELLRNVEELSLNWADYRSAADEGGDAMYTILIYAIFGLLAVLLIGIGYMYCKIRSRKMRHRDVVTMNSQVGSEDGDVYDGEEHINSSWVSGNDVRPAVWSNKKTSPGKTAECEHSESSFDDEFDEEDRASSYGYDSSPPRGAFDTATDKSGGFWIKLSRRAHGHGCSTSETPEVAAGDVLAPDDSVLPSEVSSHLGRSADIEDGGSSMGDMTASVREREEVDLILSDYIQDESILSGENSVSITHSYQVDLLSSFKRSSENEVGLTSSQSISRSDAPPPSEVGDRQVDVSLLASELPHTDLIQGNDITVEETTPVTRSLFAKVWQKKKQRDTPPSNLSPLAAEVMGNEVDDDETSDALNAAEYKAEQLDFTRSELGPCMHDDIKVLAVSDDMTSCISALSIGGVSEISCSTKRGRTEVQTRAQTEEELRKAGASEPLQNTTAWISEVSLQQTAIPEAEVEVSTEGASDSTVTADEAPYMLAHHMSESEEAVRETVQVLEAAATGEEDEGCREGTDFQQQVSEETSGSERVDDKVADAIESDAMHVPLGDVRNLSFVPEEESDEEPQEEVITSHTSNSNILDQSVESKPPSVYEDSCVSEQGSQLPASEIESAPQVGALSFVNESQIIEDELDGENGSAVEEGSILDGGNGENDLSHDGSSSSSDSSSLIQLIAPRAMLQE